MGVCESGDQYEYANDALTQNETMLSSNHRLSL